MDVTGEQETALFSTFQATSLSIVPACSLDARYGRAEPAITNPDYVAHLSRHYTWPTNYAAYGRLDSMTQRDALLRPTFREAIASFIIFLVMSGTARGCYSTVQYEYRDLGVTAFTINVTVRPLSF